MEYEVNCLKGYGKTGTTKVCVYIYVYIRYKGNGKYDPLPN